MRDTDNSADVLDIRDLFARMDELRADRDGWVLGAPDGSETPNPDGWRTDEPDDAQELDDLESFIEQMAGLGGDEEVDGVWYPVTLVRDSYWREYAQNYAEEVGDPDMREAGWPYNCIDWDKAADMLQMDYSSADYDGVTYWFR